MTKEHSPDNLAEILKNVMSSANINASELAKNSGVSMASLSRILSGQVSPSIGNMLKISRALNVSLDELTGRHAFDTVDGDGGKHEHTTQLDLTIENALAVTFILENTHKSAAEAGQLLASAAAGSWVPSWTDAFTKPGTPKPKTLVSKQVGTKKIEVSLLFPQEMVEESSIANMLSVTATAVTGTGAKMLDMRIPSSLVRTFKGPAFGIQGLRDLLGKHGRPILSATMRPMLGLSPKMYGRAVFETLSGGVDMTCDPTLMHSMPNSYWRERFRYVAEAAHSATEDTNETKTHVMNVSAGTVEQILERAAFAKELEINVLMVDSASIGWSALQSLTNWSRRNGMIVCAMGGRALNAPVLSEQLQAKLLRFAGCDVVSMGSPLRGNIANRRFANGIIYSLRRENPVPSPDTGVIFDQPTIGIASAFPAVGGGHNPWHFPRLIDALGDDCIIQCGGSVMGHPWGSSAGATANRVALEAVILARGEGHNLSVEGHTILQRAMRYNSELKAALDYWQEGSFLFGVVTGHGGKEGIEGVVLRNSAQDDIKVTKFKPRDNKDKE